MQPLYDAIGVTYGATRHVDPFIAQALATYVGAKRGGLFLDLACGTGNYTCALEAVGGQWHGIDISVQMLAQAMAKSRSVTWQCADACAIPYSGGSFAGVICTLAIHHFPELNTPFSEVFRVLRAGLFVLFTAFPEQMRNYWLCHYFPQMMARSIEKMPSEADIASALRGAGFAVQDAIPFHVTNELQDLFLYSGKDRPEIYLNPNVRSNISSFATQCSSLELESGLRMLRSDIESHRFHDVIRSYSVGAGEYAFVIAEKGIK
ncbi:MAG TPA: class I SAM-dependent methyltransferase [Steroidobacteraceae bacterium]